MASADENRSLENEKKWPLKTIKTPHNIGNFLTIRDESADSTVALLDRESNDFRTVASNRRDGRESNNFHSVAMLSFHNLDFS